MSERPPQYLKLKRHILRHITNGDWPPLSRVPSENELVSKFGISRMTVNRAMRELADAGMVTRTQGAGTFVAERKAESAMFEVRSIRDEIISRGQKHTVEILIRELVSARPVTARQFALPTGAKLYHSRLLHRADDEPLQLEDRFVNPVCAPDYLEIDFYKEIPHQYLMRTAPLQRIEHTIEAEAASKRLARLLAVEPGGALLTLTRRTWSHDHVASYVRLSYPAGKFRFVGAFNAGDFKTS